MQNILKKEMFRKLVLKCWYKYCKFLIDYVFTFNVTVMTITVKTSVPNVQFPNICKNRHVTVLTVILNREKQELSLQAQPLIDVKNVIILTACLFRLLI